MSLDLSRDKVLKIRNVKPFFGANMKTTLSLLISVLFAASAHAAVVDHFNCKITAVKADRTALYSSEVDSYSLRMTMQSETNPTGWVSFSRIVLKAAGKEGNNADMSLQYQHAVEFGPDGKAARARQTLCFDGGAMVGHTGTASACSAPSPDPFAPDAHGWDDTDLKDGVPVFNVQGLRPSVIPMPDGSKVTFSCDFLGTEQ